jgi:hypothetical protein
MRRFNYILARLRAIFPFNEYVPHSPEKEDPRKRKAKRNPPKTK